MGSQVSTININKGMDSTLEELDKLFTDSEGYVVPVDYDIVKNIPYEDLRIYMHFKGIYGLVTSELCDWLEEKIAGRKAIEIGCGVGTLGRDLGIILTDAKMQEVPEIMMQYKLMGQPLIKYPKDVIKMDAITAAKKYKPKVVVGSWITSTNGQNTGESSSNRRALNNLATKSNALIGVDERLLIKECDTYFLVGNDNLHSNNALFSNPRIEVTVHRLPFLISRNKNKDMNAVYEFKRKF